MDLFKYMAAATELHNTTLVGKLEELCRKHHYDSGYTSTWNASGYLANDYQRYKLYYKLITLSLRRHSECSKAKLPDFLHNCKSLMERTLLYHFLEDDTRQSEYTEFMDVFEFDTLLRLPNHTNIIINLDNLVGSNPIHFKLSWNYSATYFDKFSTSFTQDSERRLLFALRHKLAFHKDSPRTILDDFLAYSKQECTMRSTKIPQIDASITQLEQQIVALKAFKELHEQ